jgi:heme/copper-type cytochrome/quinol oxidase subunit 2
MPRRSPLFQSVLTVRFLVVALGLAAIAGTAVHAAIQARREFHVSARRYAYTVSGSDNAEIRVQVNDLVKITLEAEDIPHSLTIDEYRISKRAEPGKPTVIEFRADKPGTFVMYCNLMIDERCRKETRGTLVVSER